MECCEHSVKKVKERREEHHACKTEGKRWYKERLFQVVAFLAGVQLIHIILDRFFGITALHNLLVAFYGYVEMIWLPLLIGILLGGLIDVVVPEEYITRYLALHRKRTILNAVGLGFLMSACSHGILAIAMTLYRKGASTPAVIAFLLASPWTNLPVTILLFGFFGWKALVFILSALGVAIITGLIYQMVDARGKIECANHNPDEEIAGDDFSLLEDVKCRVKKSSITPRSVAEMLVSIVRSSWELTRMIVWWILIGMFLAAFMQAYVPQHIFEKYLGKSILGMIGTLVLATVLEVCSEGTAPLAFEIYRQTGAFGNAFIFLMAGVATDYTEIGLIWSNIGKRAAILLPIVTVPQIILLGYLFNLFL